MTKTKIARAVSVWRTRRSAWEQILSQAYVIDLFVGWCALSWTFLLTVPGNLFATNRSFLGLERHGHETAWAMWTGALCVLWAARIIYPLPVMRSLYLLLGVLVWLFIASSIALTSPHWHGLPVNTGFYIYAGLSAYSVWGVWVVWSFVVVDLMGHIPRRNRRSGGAE